MKRFFYIIQYKKNSENYLVRCEFKIVFNIHQCCPYVMSKLSDNKTMIPWKNFLEKVIDDFKDKGYTFHHIAEMHFITIAHKMEMSYDFFLNKTCMLLIGKFMQ